MAGRKSGQKQIRIGQPSKVGTHGNRVIDYLKRGNYVSTAARACGLHEDTVADWLDWGTKDPDGDYGDFAFRAKEAMAVAEDESLKQMRAGDTNWKGAADFLRRRHRRRWSTGKDYDVVRAFDRILDAVVQHAPSEAAGKIALVIERALEDTVGEVDC